MSDTPFQEPDATADQASPGELLRRERETLGLSREEVAAALNLRPAVISGLEKDSYEEVPIATYRRGYLRSYASLLGLDEERVLAAYHARFGKEDLEHKVAPVHVLNKPPSRLGTWLFRLVTLIVIAGLIGLTLMWWQSRGGSEPPAPGDNAPVAVDGMDGNTALVEESSSPTSGNASTTGSDGSYGVSNNDGSAGATDNTANLLEAPEGTAAPADDATGNSTTDGTAETDSSQSDGAADEAAPESASTGDEAAPAESQGNADSESAPQAEAASQTAQATARVLNLTFNEQSWTEIFDASNQRVFVGLQEPGTTARVEGEPPFRLTVGNATGVELNWNGEAIDLSERAGANNVARFTLGE
ncbi:RodZ domain-containing protein [Halomonas halmophila]|uniref:Cytoskeleton protein RodZ n=1 Tax=Halomonas halmophila TaxID=252 RepID=A0A4Y4F613_9GAMM|nr:RodZ domain-containing protein [Halomonas halmophila]GED23050.1 cytoskeleton protein RodZ [Halomonas halmophila]